LKLQVNLFFRKSEAGFYSIENVFNAIEPFLNQKFNIKNINLPESSLNYKAVKANLKFVSNNKAKINHITGHVNYIALVTGKNTVLTIHDMISAFQGNLIKRVLIYCFWFFFPALLVKRITVISEHSKREVLKYLPFAKSKVIVILNPISNGYNYHPKSFNFNKPHILCVGTKENKNLDRIFKALDSLNCKVTIIGKLNKNQKHQLKAYQIEYKNLIDLSEDEIIRAYINCDLLCFPSLYEGFGMPIIEAQAVGRPVLTSNIGAMKEISMGTTCLVDPLDYKAIRKGLEKIINDESYRQELEKKGLENSKRFRAESVAKEYIKVYEEIATL
jgi:glycosyltransferase involved in cell wall biosynthesis